MKFNFFYKGFVPKKISRLNDWKEIVIQILIFMLHKNIENSQKCESITFTLY